MREILNFESADIQNQKENVARYCILMEDRRVRATNELDQYYKGEYQFVPAVIDKVKSWHGLNKTIHKIVSENLNRPYIHILEDDVLFTSKKSREYFEEVFKTLPNDWDIFLAGAYTDPENYIKVSDTLFKMRKFSALHCVIFRNTTYKYILENTTEHMDYFLSKKKLNVYLCNPTVAIQYPGYSYQLRKSLDYHHIENKMNILRDY